MSLSEIWETRKKEFLSAVGIIASVATIFTAITFIEDRYVLAADFTKQIQSQHKILKDFRIQQLEDKIFELEFKEQSGMDTPLDRALKERYKQQLDRANK